jgi:preprotein translocase subunit YajC
MMNLILVAQASQGSGMSMIIMMVAIFAIMWFFMIKPQQKKQKEIQKFQNELTEGTEVVTGGGIDGTVRSDDMTNNAVDEKIARDVVITVEKTSVFASVQQQQQK